MKKLFMGISLVLALSVTLALIYWFYPHTNPPISSSGISSEEGNTGMLSGSSFSGSSLLVPEVSDSTISGSGSQTGSIVSHSSLPVKFQKPNTEWKERDITLTDGRTLHYVFGEGNPKEVALTLEEVKSNQEKCQNPENSPDFMHEFCSESSGYVTPDMEHALKSTLSDPQWEDILTQCKENLISLREGKELYSKVLSGNLLDINSFLKVDPVSGRKILDMSQLLSVRSWLYNGTQQAWHETQGGEAPYVHPTCVDQYIPEILRQFTITRNLYISPGIPLPKDISHPKMYQISR